MPFFCVNKLLIIKIRSLVVLTGKNRLLGTLIPTAPLKLLMAAPDAVSNCITFKPLSKVFDLDEFHKVDNSKLINFQILLLD